MLTDDDIGHEVHHETGENGSQVKRLVEPIGSDGIDH
jgi:hypothetical protein